MTSVYVNDIALKGTGKLGDSNRPFHSCDDALLAWYDCPSRNDKERLSIIFPMAGCYRLRLDEYRNVNIVGTVPGVIVQNVLTSTRSPRFINVKFAQIDHQVVLPVADNLSPNGTSIVAPIHYAGINNYDDESSLAFVGASDASLASTAPIVGQVINAAPIQNPILNAPTIPDVVSFAVIEPGATVDVAGPWTIESPGRNVRIATLNNGVFNVNARLLSYGSGAAVAGSGTTRFTNNAINPGTVYIPSNPRNSFITATSGPVIVDSVKLNAVGPNMTNSTSLRNNERSTSVDQLAAVFLFLDTTAIPRTTSTTNFLGVSTVKSLGEPMPKLGDFFTDIAKFFFDLFGPISATKPRSPIQITNTTINGTGLNNGGFQVYATNNSGAVVDNSDFTAAKIYPAVNVTYGSNGNDALAPRPIPVQNGPTGPVFASYGSSSPVWNGSTFITPITIIGNYTHTRLDGTIFYIDANSVRLGISIPMNPNAGSLSSTNGNENGNVERGCVLECSPYGHATLCRRQCPGLIITLPSGSSDTGSVESFNDTFWNGRVVKYKRIDSSKADVTIILAFERGGRCLSISPGESIELQNVNGRYYLLSRLRGYNA